MRVAFIGGTRFIGPNAAQACVAAGHEVAVLHRGVHPNPVDDASSILVDRRDATALTHALSSYKPDVVVDTRAMSESDARTSATAVAAASAPMVVLSSQDVYGQFGRINGLPAGDPEAVITEASPLTVPFPFRGLPGPHEHDYDKKDVERIIREAVGAKRLPAAIVVRLPPVYGHGDPVRRFGGIIDRLLDAKGHLPHIAGATWRWTHGHVRDVAHAIRLAVEALAAGKRGYSIYNVGELETPTMAEWAERFATYCGLPLHWKQASDLPPELAHLGRMPNDIIVSTEKIRTELGFAEVTTNAKRVRDIVEWAIEARDP